jgi:hypothetical protein
MLLFAALLAFGPLQTPGGAEPPPDALGEAPPAAEAPAEAPAVEAPPLVELAPAEAAETPAPDRRPPAPPPPSGIDPVGVAAIQIGVGAGACCAGCCIAAPVALGLSLGVGLIPVVGTLVPGLAADAIIGTTIGVAETWAGDALGKERAPLIWPVVASVGLLASGTVFSAAAALIEPRPLVDLTSIDPSDPVALAAAFGAAGGGILTTAASYYSLFACAGAVVLPAVVYAITATEKKPGDPGGFPGIMEPANPTGAQTARAADAPSAALAMRY